MIDHGAPSSFQSINEGVDVVSADGARVGALEYVLFDGLVIDVSAGPGGHRFVDAPEFAELRERAVLPAVQAADVATLPQPSASPAVMQHGGEEDAEGPLARRLRRSWDLLTGRH